MKTTARAVTQSHVITVSPDDPLLNVHRLFVEEEISGAPVVSETGRVLGVITSADLVRSVLEERDRGRSDSGFYPDPCDFGEPGWLEPPGGFRNRLGEFSVSEVMTEGVVCVCPDTPVSEVARTFRENGVHRVLVIEKDRLVGIISALDLVSLLED